jgi:hypothetical protein
MRLTDARAARRWNRADLSAASGLPTTRILDIERDPACADATERAILAAVYRLSVADLWPEASSNE